MWKMLFIPIDASIFTDQWISWIYINHKQSFHGTSSSFKMLNTDSNFLLLNDGAASKWTLLLYCSFVFTMHINLQGSAYPKICIDRLVQERRNSSALAMELCLSCTNPLVYTWFTKFDLFQNSLYRIYEKILLKSTCLTDSFICMGFGAMGYVDLPMLWRSATYLTFHGIFIYKALCWHAGEVSNFISDLMLQLQQSLNSLWPSNSIWWHKSGPA